MMIERSQLVKCPCCEADFEIRHPQEFKVSPMSDEEKKYLQKLQEELEKLNIKTTYGLIS